MNKYGKEIGMSWGLEKFLQIKKVEPLKYWNDVISKKESEKEKS